MLRRVNSRGGSGIILFLQQTVDKFLLEIVERLLQTVRGCKGRMECSALFEPESLDKALSPVQMMVDKREKRVIFCKVPLVSAGSLMVYSEVNYGFVRGFSGDMEPTFSLQLP